MLLFTLLHWKDPFNIVATFNLISDPWKRKRNSQTKMEAGKFAVTSACNCNFSVSSLP